MTDRTDASDEAYDPAAQTDEFSEEDCPGSSQGLPSLSNNLTDLNKTLPK